MGLVGVEVLVARIVLLFFFLLLLLVLLLVFIIIFFFWGGGWGGQTFRKLDFVLGLTTAKIMERRLQTKVGKNLRSLHLLGPGTARGASGFYGEWGKSRSLNSRATKSLGVSLRTPPWNPKSYTLPPPPRHQILQVFKLGLAKSIHHARTLIRQRHIRVPTSTSGGF